MLRLLFCLSLLLIGAGCQTPARKLDPAVTAQIKTGQTRAEVEQILGPPKEMETGSNGNSVAVYVFTKGGRSGFLEPTDVELRVLSLLYNRKFEVEKTLRHDSVTDVANKPFVATEYGQAIPRERIVAVMKPGTTREEVIAAFGPPAVETLTVEGGSVLEWVAGRQRLWSWRGSVDMWSFRVVCAENGMVLDYKVSGTLDGKMGEADATAPAKPAAK